MPKARATRFFLFQREDCKSTLSHCRFATFAKHVNYCRTANDTFHIVTNFGYKYTPIYEYASYKTALLTSRDQIQTLMKSLNVLSPHTVTEILLL